MLSSILAVFTSFFLALFLTPLMVSVAKRFNIYDIPNIRKNHAVATPLLGGVAIFAATVVSVIIFSKVTNIFNFVVFLNGALGVTIMGLIDDIITLSPKRRILILVCIALIVYFGFIQFYFSEKIMLDSLLAKVIFFFYVIFWIVGTTNAVNFSDGLDGLASYLSLISCVAFAVIFCVEGRGTFILTITLSLCGGIAGFIPYNRNPALVFMGDAGSMFIGFMVGLLSIASIVNENSLFSLVVPLYILFIPLLDMFLSIVRRLVMKKSILKPDNLHFHHRLYKRIKDQIKVVVILSLIQIVFAIAGICIFITKLYLLGWIIIGIFILTATIYTIKKYSKHENSIVINNSEASTL